MKATEQYFHVLFKWYLVLRLEVAISKWRLHVLGSPSMWYCFYNFKRKPLSSNFIWYSWFYYSLLLESLGFLYQVHLYWNSHGRASFNNKHWFLVTANLWSFIFTITEHSLTTLPHELHSWCNECKMLFLIKHECLTEFTQTESTSKPTVLLFSVFDC